MEKAIRSHLSKYLLAAAIAVLTLAIAFPAGALAAEEGSGFWDDPIGSISNLFGTSDLGTESVESQAVADPSTSDQWENYIFNSTENTGRIWTDKSVTADESATLDGQVVTKTAGSDFMVSLSALSSVLDSKSTVAVPTEPLDIVLVLDTSGSMAFTMDGDESGITTVYEPVYELDKNKTYYVKSDSEYVEVYYSWGSWRTGVFGSSYIPMTSAEDSDSSHTQFYKGVKKKAETRMDALRASVDDFLSQVQEQNKGLDAEDQHRVALVKFASSEKNSVGNTINRQGYNNSQVVKDFTTSTSAITEEVNKIEPAGATQANYGMNQAMRVINGDKGTASGHDALVGAREGSQKVVIFFTDGTPTSGSSFESDVANSAVKTAKELKADNVSVYSVGIFEGASAELPGKNTSKENRFMHAVSSNYPQANSYDRLGVVSEDPHYYKTAATSEELKDIFKEIFEDITSNSGLPTEVEPGKNAANSGYITFTDKLGDYMTVAGVNGLMYDGVLYDQIEASVSADGKTTTYVFKGNVAAKDEKHPLMKLENIVMTVTAPDNGAAAGDVVTVKVPAANIPTRHFDVQGDAQGNIMTVCDTTPVRVLYSVALRDGVEDELSSADDALNTYIAANLQDGKVNFYSNDFDRENGDAFTTAVYVPAKTNPYYYFVQNVQLFVKSGNEYVPAQGDLDLSQKYYYKNYFYELKDGSSVDGNLSGSVDAEYKWVEISGKALKQDSPFVYQDDEGNLMVKAGCPKHARVGNTVVDKAENPTNTAPLAIKYQWAGEGKVSVALGNNGVLQKAALGNLVLSKSVASEDGVTAPDTSFVFKVTLKDAAGNPIKGEFKAATPESNDITVTFNENGIAKVILKADESCTIKGLPVGAQFEIVENSVEGFTPSVQDNSGEADDAKGVITSAGAQVAFTNTFAPFVLNGATEFNGTKVLDGRDWKEGEAFSFTMTPDAQTKAAMDAGILQVAGADEDTQVQTVTVTSPASPGYKAGVEYGFNFGDMTVKKAGTYTFTIAEVGSVAANGLTYDDQVYTMTLNVTHENGQWAVEKILTDKDGEAATDVAFVNTYKAKGTLAITLEKELVGRDWTDGETYEFTIEPAVAGDASTPMPETTTVTVGKPDSGNTAEIVFPEITYTSAQSGTFTYKVTETVPQEAAPGMTYDAAPITVTVVAEDNGTGTITPVQQSTPDSTFTNKYEASVAYSQVGGLSISKTLKNHDIAAGQFGFTIQAADDVSAQKMASIDSEWTDASYVKTVVNTNAAAADSAVAIELFSGLEFSTADDGVTYTYTVKEQIPEGYEKGDVVNGYTYDTTLYTVKITATDNKAGVISVKTVVTDDSGNETVYEGSSASDKTSPAVLPFQNSYEAEGCFALNATKVLNGRDMQDGEFTFVADYVFSDSGADDPVAVGKSTASPAGIPSAISFGEVTYTKTDLLKLVNSGDASMSVDGKTIILPLTVAEDTDSLPAGVSPAQSGYMFAVTFVDNGDGTLTSHVSYPEGETAFAFANTYKAESVGVEMKGQKALNLSPEDAGLALTPADVAGQFTFTLAAEDGAPMPQDGNGEEVTSVTNDAQGQINFGIITFSAEDMDGASSKTFTYTVTESNTNGTVGGITNDPEPKQVAITVTDQGDGTLTATTDSALLFRFDNTYSVEPVTATLPVHKILNGRDLAEGEFTFALMDANNLQGPALQEVANNAAGDAAFTLSFDKPGTYSYLVKEVRPAQAFMGVQYDDTTYNVSAVVTDAKNGTLSVAWNVSDGTSEAQELSDALQFTNTYAATGFIPALGGTKVVDGRDWKDGESFSFTIEAADSATTAAVEAGIITLPQQTTVSLKATADNPKFGGEAYPFSFAEMKVTEAGTYKFAISEVQPDDPGKTDLNYDKGTYLATVVVFDENNNGVLSTTVSYDREVADGDKTSAEHPEGIAPVFVNDFIEQPVSLEVPFTKELVGRDWQRGESFTFNVAAVSPENAPMAANNTVKAVKPAHGNEATFAFNFEFTVDDLGGASSKTFKYKVSEVNAGAGGMTYDTSRDLTITVNQNKSTGLLEATYEVDGGNAFVNTYAAKKVVTSITDAISLTKELEGRALHAGDFTFGMFDESGKQVATGVNAADGTVQMSTLTFDAIGTYAYTIKEIVPDSPEKGMTYSDKVYKVKATVTDPYTGQLKVDWKLQGLLNKKMVFKNSFTPEPVEATPHADFTKYVIGREWQDGEAFTFKVMANADTPKAPLPAETEITVSSNDGQSAFFFVGPFEYSLSDLGKNIKSDVTKTFKYDIVEVAGTDAAMTYDTTPRTLEITVSYDYDKGQLTAQTKVLGSYLNPMRTVFVNTYEAPAVTVEGTDMTFTKQVTGRQWADKESFTFTITPDQRKAPMPERSTVTVEAPAEGAAVDFNFGNFTIDMDDLGRTVDGDVHKTFTYTVKEKTPFGAINGTFQGMTYDTYQRQVALDVDYDYATGQLTAEVRDITAPKAPASVVPEVFNNIYQSQTTYCGILVEKTLVGHSADAGQFSFSVTPVNDEAKAKMGEEAQTVSTPAAPDGATAKVRALQGLKFTQEDAGKTFTFQVTENIPADAVNGALDGYTYDQSAHEISIVVKDNGKGRLTTTTFIDGEKVKCEAPSVAFENSYEATTTDATAFVVNAHKTLDGRALKAGEFEFVLTDALGHEIETVTNAADGSITFSPINYASANFAADVEVGKATAAHGVYEYAYTVAEKADLPAGVSQSYGSEQIVVRVSDNGDGTLSTEAVYADNGEANQVDFVNVYDAEAVSLSFTGEKNLELSKNNLALTLGDIAGKFTFTLTGEEGAPMPENVAVVADEAGNFSFGPLTYELEDLDGATEKTFTYEVTESVTPGMEDKVGGVSLDTDTHEIRVTVKDNGDGTLSASKSAVYDFGPQVVMTNTYTVEDEESSLTGEGNLTIQKSLTNRELKEGEFTFEMWNTSGEKVAEATNAADGSVTFAPLTFTHPDNYLFTVTEFVPADEDKLPGVTYDASVYQVEAQVQDDLDGTMSVNWHLMTEGAESINFHNEFTPSEVTVDAKTDAHLTFTKEVVGRDWLDDEVFTFTLTQDAGDASDEHGEEAEGEETTPVATTTIEVAKPESGNSAEFAVGPLTFDMSFFGDELTADAEKFVTYTLAENEGIAGGMTYDITARQITVKLAYDYSEGTLSAEVVDVATADASEGTEVDPQVFVNTYEVEELTSSPTGEGNLTITKKLSGRDLASGEFEFVMKSKSGDEVLTAANNADGKVDFGALTFNQAGTYTYTISEVVDKDAEGVTFDKAKHKVQAVVTDNFDGTLSVEWNAVDGNDNITFVNDFTAPVDPDADDADKMPQTNDSPLGGILLGIVAGFAGVGAFAYYRFRRQQ